MYYFFRKKLRIICIDDVLDMILNRGSLYVKFMILYCVYIVIKMMYSFKIVLKGRIVRKIRKFNNM